MFRAMDLNGDGKLQKDEIKKGFTEYFRRNLTDMEVDELFAQVDSDENGEIEYTEFLAATLNEKNLLSNKKLETAFQMFDKDGSGYISGDEIKEIFQFGHNLDQNQIQQIIKQVDANSDGLISYKEFLQMMLQNIE